MPYDGREDKAGIETGEEARCVRVTIDLLGRQVCCSPLLCFFVALKVSQVSSPLDGMHYINTALHVMTGLLGCQVIA